MKTFRELYKENRGVNSADCRYVSDAYNMVNFDTNMDENLEKAFYIESDTKKRDRLRELLKDKGSKRTVRKRSPREDFNNWKKYFDNELEYTKYLKYERLIYNTALWVSIKRELEIKTYLDDIITKANEIAKDETEYQYSVICYLIEQKYKWHEGILDVPKDDYIFREEINQIIFDYLQLKINEISQRKPPEQTEFIARVPKKPFKWNANKKSLGTLFGVLFNHGIIEGNKVDFRRQLEALFDEAPSFAYSNDLISLSSDKSDPENPKPKYCKKTEDLLADWVEFLQSNPTKQK